MNSIPSNLSHKQIFVQIEKILSSGKLELLIQYFEEIGLKNALSSKIINIARIKKNNKLVVFLSTLAMENNIDFEFNSIILDVYLSIEKKSFQLNNKYTSSFKNTLKILIGQNSKEYLLSLNLAERDIILFLNFFMTTITLIVVIIC